MSSIKTFEEFNAPVNEGKSDSYAKQFTEAVIKGADAAKDALRRPIFDHQDPAKPEVADLEAEVHRVLKAVHALYDKAVETHKKLK